MKTFAIRYVAPFVCPHSNCICVSYAPGDIDDMIFGDEEWHESER